MAEAVLTDTAASIIKALGSLPLLKIGLPWDFKDELQKLWNTICTIQAVHLDAEKQQAHNHAVKDWLGKVKDAMFEVDDLLDDYSTELLQRQVMTRDKKAKQVRIFFSKSNQLAYGFKMVRRVNKVRKTLDEIAADRAKFHFNVGPTVTGTRFERRWGEVIGRECETKELVKLLLNFDVNENVSIIPIVGMGGVGKTTLAQHAYNDEEVERQFDVRLWACVSDAFDVTSIVAKLIASATKKRPENLEMDLLQSRLRETIDGKRFLLILDDVQNENSERWLRLKTLLVGGMRGSKVLITTRSERVAEITGTAPTYRLGSLSVSNSWDLFKKMAFKHGEEPNNPKLIEIGREIVQMCWHIPLAIRSIGSLLSYTVSEDDWLYCKNNIELYNITRQENDILPILKLSYDYLPAGLKQCFAFCSLVPKDCDIYVEVLIQLWIAQGFIHSSNRNRCLEDVGREYFMDLCYRSFFQDIQRNEYGDIEKCKIHDLIHDLAHSVAGNEYNPYAEKVVEGTRHVAFDSLYSLRDIPTSLPKADKIRTFLLQFPTMPPSRLRYPTRPSCLRYPTRPSHLRFRPRPRQLETVHDTLISSLKSLRALNLSASNIREVPDSIGKLKHLRFLDLSRNFYIELLPTSITKLPNLQTLRLDFCSGLNELPEDTRNLINLRHLGLYDCRSLTHMPHGLGNLTALQTLTLFTLGKKENSVLNQNVGLGELDSLDELRGELCIKGLEHLRSSPLEAKAANLERKQHLQILGLEWGPEAGDDSAEIISNDEHLLENLRPHLNLKQLIIDGYAGVRLSGWVSSLSKLVSIYISDCKWCQYIPPLDRFPFLKSLVLRNLSALEYISNDGSDVSSSSLESLELDTLPKLRGWWRMSEVVTAEHDSHHHLPSFPSFPFLSSLSIKNCRMMSLIQVIAPGSETTPSSSSPYYDLSKLKSVFLEGLGELESLPEEWLQNLTSLEILNISWCSKLRISMSPLFQHLTVLKDLQLSNCMELISNEDEKGAECLGPTTLRHLYLENITSLVSLPGELRHVTTLQWLDIKNCPTLKSLPEWIDQTSLQTLRIQNCSNLISLPEGMRGLTSLRCLTIAGCPDLEKRCKKETGEDWLKIAHVLYFSNQPFYESNGMDL